MKPIPCLLAVALLMALGTINAHAQSAIQLDVPVSGELTADSPRADDGTPYVLYVYRGQPGERVRIQMASDAFDSWLAAGSVAAPGCSSDCRNDDDSGGGLNASLAYTLPASGEVQIRANSINSDDQGPFTVSVTRLPPPAAPVTRAARVGEPASGQFSDTTATRDDSGIPYDIWTLQGQPGQTLTVRMESDDFDAYLQSGRLQGDDFQVEYEDDDGGNQLNARLRVPLDSRGRGLVRATSYAADARGSYRLTVSEPPRQREVTVADLAVGESVRGRLDDNDPFTVEDEIRYDVYRINGTPGQRVVVRMESPDFDALLRWGLYDGENFIEDQRDDDSGGGTSAQFTVTLDAEGEGRLHATAWDASEGSYTLSVVAAPRAAR
ncbi:MAG: hypothetical protein Q4F49_09085 [Pseudoxanthomonas suwonensis]|nr:hypothetical protein [Pseudoxanthomonas suwonensis]